MPSDYEYEEGDRNLERVDNKVDYILTHTCPTEVIYSMVDYYKEGEEELQQYLQRVADRVEFEGWYFGHFHIDEDLDNFHCLYDEIVMLE